MHSESVLTPHGGTVVRGSSVRVSGDPARVGVPGPAAFIPQAGGESKPSEPRIEIIKDGEVIQAIDIVCSCGQHIRLNCVYTE
jgi:hypothetical protein